MHARMWGGGSPLLLHRRQKTTSATGLLRDQGGQSKRLPFGGVSAWALDWFVWRVPQQWGWAQWWSIYREQTPFWAMVLAPVRLLVFPASAVFFVGLALTRRVWIWPLLLATIVMLVSPLLALAAYGASRPVGLVIEDLTQVVGFVGISILLLTPAFRRSVNPPEASARDARFLARAVAIFMAALLPFFSEHAFESWVWRVLAEEATWAQWWSVSRHTYPAWALVLAPVPLLAFPASAAFFLGLALTGRVWIWALLAATIVMPVPVLTELATYGARMPVGAVIEDLAEVAGFAGLFVLFLTPAFRRSVNAGR